MQVTLQRTVMGKHGTFGVLALGDVPLCVTLEEVWADNKPRISCVPAGLYEVVKYSGTKYKDVWMLKNVPGRSAILIHWGNTTNNTAGCILVGKWFEKFGTMFGVAASQETFGMLRKNLPDKFDLLIKNPA